MNKKVISLILAVCLLFTAAAQNIGIVFAAEAPPFSVSAEYNGEKAEEIVVPQNEKRTLTAVCNPQEGEYTYNWQILADVKADLWVNITGQTANTLDVSYALLSSVLDQSGSAYLRCAVSSQGFTAYSKPVCATVSFTPNIAFEPVKASSSAPSPSPRALPRADEEGYVYITVNYYDAVSGNSLFGSHTSKIEENTPFTEIVHSPTQLGFAPFYYSDDWDKEKTNPDTDNPENNTKAENAASINFGTLLTDKVTEDITVNVYYWAIDVPYAVKYMFQNIHDDYYTEQTNLYYNAQAKTGTIISDDELQDNSGNPAGFSALYHYPEAVAADGSTVFECYYDRNYYYIKFDLGGGYGTDPIYARYDTPIVINTPTRPGYTFVGWDELTINEDGTPGGSKGTDGTEVPSRIGTENRYYRAIWEKAQTHYTVIYWLESANDEGYSYLGYNKYDANAEEKVKVDTNLKDAEGVKDDDARLATLRFFELNEEKSDEFVTIKGDGSAVANVYYDRKEYTLKFYYARSYKQGNTTHNQICGNTSEFSDHDKDGQGTNNLATMLSYVNGNWSDVTKIPALKNDNGHYQTGTETINHNNTNYTYYYFTFKDKYGADISDEWPIEVLEMATLVNARNGSKNAYFSAWNPEHHSYYPQHCEQEFNNNRTVKGRFQKLDRRLLYDDNDYNWGDAYNDKEIRLLAFWTNSCPKVDWDKTRKWVYNIYLQDVNGNMPQAPSYSVTTYDTNDKPNEQTTPSIVGFRHSDTTSNLNQGKFDDNDCLIHEVNFYYERTKYDLQFYNNGDILKDHEYKLPFEFKIGDELMRLVKNDTAIPQYPSNLEPNAYYFEGWYTTADCAEGSGYIRRYTEDGEWKQGRAYYNEMDANKLILYANWKPVQREVRFFKNYQDYLNYQENPDDNLIFQTSTNNILNKDKVFTLPHGNVVGTIDFPKPATEGEQFVGWFYMNDGVKTMFTPADTPVKGNLNIFADWKSNNPQPYRIQYMKYGTEEKIADDTFGYAYQGSTRTFVPKAGGNLNQLYENYNNGWYPTVASHSITIQPDDKENPAVNIYTFYYVPVPNLPYMVKYVDKDTGKELAPPKTENTNKLSVVTERFVPVENYVPDAFYKRLVLSAKLDENGNSITKPEDNVIIFYYTPSTTTAFYAVHYMLQKPGTDPSKPESYVESDFHTEGTGNIDEKMTVKPLDITGYTATDKAVVVYGGDNTDNDHIEPDTDGNFTFEIKSEGSELYIYYKLNKYSYTVKYLNYNDKNEKVKPDVVRDPVQYGTTVTETADPVPSDWTALAPTEQSLTIKAYTATSGEQDPNVIVFYYIPKTYAAEYKVAGGIGGTLDNYGGKAVANADGIYHFKGSAPMPEAGFEFVGWFTDEKCENPVKTEWVDNENRLIPQIEGMKPEPEKNIYYAKFEELTGDLTIERENADDEGNGNQVFVYKVTSTTDETRTIFVTVTREGSTTIHDLRYGKYTVEQVNNWSWRYSDEAKPVTLEEKGETTVEFGKTSALKKWLNGNSGVKVNQSKKVKKGEEISRED